MVLIFLVGQFVKTGLTVSESYNTVHLEVSDFDFMSRLGFSKLYNGGITIEDSLSIAYCLQLQTMKMTVL